MYIIFIMATVILQNIPDELKNSFKATCAQKGTTMKAEFIRFMKESVGQEVIKKALEKKKRRKP